jgi:hypothetical protein
MSPLAHLRVAEDGGAVFFGMVDRKTLIETLCELLGATIEGRHMLVWVERVELRTDLGPLVLFNDEDGSSHPEMTAIDAATRVALVARLQAAAAA